MFERDALRLGEKVPDGVFEGGFGHGVTAHMGPTPAAGSVMSALTAHGIRRSRRMGQAVVMVS